MDIVLAAVVFVSIGILGRFMQYGINNDDKEYEDED